MKLKNILDYPSSSAFRVFAGIGCLFFASDSFAQYVILSPGAIPGTDYSSVGTNGIYSNGNNSPAWDVSFSGSTTANNNTGFAGMRIDASRKINFSGPGYTFTANNNGRGIYVDDAGEIKFTGMNLNLDGNGVGLAVDYSSSFTMIGDGSHSLTASNNNGHGISPNRSLVEIHDVNITADENGDSGVHLHGSSMILNSASGSNVITASNNDVDGIGLYSAESVSNFSTTNYNIFADNNGSTGIWALTAGVIDFSGNGSNTLSSSGNGTSGVSIGDAGTEFNVFNMNVAIDNNGADGINIKDGAIAEISSSTTNSLTLNGNSSGSGAFVKNSGSVLTIRNMDVETNGNAAGFWAQLGGKIVIEGKSGGRNSLIINNNTGFGLVADNNAQLEITRMNVQADNSGAAVTSEGGSVVTINDSSMVSSALALNTYGSSGSYIINGSSIESAAGELLHGNAATSNLTAANSYLKGSILKDVNAVNATMSNTAWDMAADSNITSLTANNSQINLRGTGYNTLNVDNLSGSGNVYTLRTYFDGNGTNTDKIVVNGSLSGTNQLNVISSGTNGADTPAGSDGILVVDATGAANTGTFTLVGGKIDSGAYEYILNHAADNNWYLQSNGVMTGVAKAVSNLPAIHLSMVRTGMNELRKRIGELRDNDPAHKDGLWARSYAKHLKVDEFIDSRMNLFGFEAGYDKQIYGDCDQKVYAGLMAGYLYTDNIKNSLNTGGHGEAHANTPSLGVYMTWVHRQGWFFDATLREFWSDMSATSYNNIGQAVAYDPDRNFTTASLEFGRQLAYNADEYSKYILEPKAEILYGFAKAKSFTTTSGNDIHYGYTESITTRLALMLGYNRALDNGMILEPFVEFGLSREWNGRTDIKYAGSNFRSDLKGTGYDMSLGLNAKLDKQWNLFSEVAYETGEVYEGLSTNIGVRYNF